MIEETCSAGLVIKIVRKQREEITTLRLQPSTEKHISVKEHVIMTILKMATGLNTYLKSHKQKFCLICFPPGYNT